MRPRRRPPYLAIGVASIAVLVLVAGWILTGRSVPAPGAPVVLTGIVPEVRGLRRDAPVRVAGVRVGRVSRVRLGADGLARVRMELTDDAPPLRRGTRLRVRPRTFLEGGYAVQLEPGPPGEPVLPPHAVLPASASAANVPLPAVTGALDAATRDGLRTTVAELRRALGGSGSARGLARTLPPTLRDGTRLARAVRGTRPGELQVLLRSAAAVTGALRADRGRLAGTLAGIRRTTGALAAEEDGLRASLRELPRLAADAPRALAAVRRARPVVDGLLRDVGPALDAAPPALRAADGALEEVRALVGPAELPALLRQARPLLAELRPALADGAATLDQATPLLRCVRDRLVPAFGLRIRDGAHTTGRTVLDEFLALTVGLASSGGTFDANGWMVRLGATVGPRVLTAGSGTGVGPFAAATDGVQGARPVWYGSRGLPPFRPDARCIDQPVPDLTATARAVPTTRARPAATRRVREPAPSSPADAARLRTRLDRWLVRRDGTARDAEARP